MPGLNRIPYIGDPEGRKAGDVVYAFASPGTDFVQADGSELDTGSLGRTRLALPGTTLSTDAETSPYAGYPVVYNDELYFIADGAIKKKSTASGSLTTVWSAPPGYSSGDNSAGFWYEGGKWWRCYRSGSTFVIQYATTPGGSFTNSSSAPPAGGGPHHLFWSSYANRFYLCVQGGKPYQSTDGGVTWSPVPDSASMGNGVNWGIGLSNRVVFFQRPNGLLYHSVDAGASFLSVSQSDPYPIPDHAGNLVYNPVTGRFYGLRSFSLAIISSASPWSGGSWTLESSILPGGSSSTDAAFYVYPDGSMQVIGRTSCAYSFGDGTWYTGGNYPTTSTGAAPLLLADFDGYLHMYPMNLVRPHLIRDRLSRYKVPILSSIAGATAYIKVK